MINYSKLIMAREVVGKLSTAEAEAIRLSTDFLEGDASALGGTESSA
ncbi:hypothetical protein [Microlunatus speluncae]|nr:hypothetical protein [Microlunatus speluncae]